MPHRAYSPGVPTPTLPPRAVARTNPAGRVSVSGWLGGGGRAHPWPLQCPAPAPTSAPAPPPKSLTFLGPWNFHFHAGGVGTGWVGRGSTPSGLLPNPWRTWAGRSSRVPTLPPCASRLRVPEGARASIREGRYHLTVTLCETSLNTLVVPKENPTSKARTERCTSRVFPNYPEV